MKPKSRPPPKQKIPPAFTAYLLEGIRKIREAATNPKDLDILNLWRNTRAREATQPKESVNENNRD